MEVFSVFATLSLADMLSGPLGKVQAAMQNVNLATAALGDRMGKLALSMAPVALAAGAVLGAFGKCVSTAAGFEDQMAKVGAVSRASGEDMALLEAKARELGASTQFSAVQVAQAEQYLAMAGFKAKENVAALPGVLNLAAATATDLGRAADISSDILGAFGMKAEEMGRVADALALTCSTANTDMEKLGDTMKYVAPVARMAGMSLEETAAMAGMLGNVGIKGSQAGTTLKAMLNKLAAPGKEAKETFKKLGVTVQDSAGNLRSPVKILGEMAAGLKNMGSAQQIAALKAVVGEEAIAGFSELIKQQGIGALEEYAKQLDAAGGSAEQMAARMNDTLAGSLRGMGSAWESVQISIGKLFLPVVRKVVDAVTGLLRLLDSFAQSPIGAAILKITGAIAAGVVAVTALSAGMWALSKVGPLIVKAIMPVKAALLGLGWPVLAVIAAVAALYAAYKTNFGGMADTLNRWGRNISLVAQGVVAVFRTLSGSTGEIRGELAKDIKAAGLEKFVVTVGKIVFRIKEFFSGLWDSLNFDRALSALAPAMEIVGRLFDSLGNAIASVFGVQITSASSEARGLGEMLGGALSWSLEVVATLLGGVARAVDTVVSVFKLLFSLITGDFEGAWSQAGKIWDNICAQFMAFADLFRIGDWIRNAWGKAKTVLSSIPASISAVWDSITGAASRAWSGIANSISGFCASILQGIQGVWDSVCNAVGSAMTAIGNIVRSGWDAVAGWITRAVDNVASVFKLLFSLLTGDLDGAWSQAGKIWDNICAQFMAFADLFRIGDWIRNAWGKAKTVLSSIPASISAVWDSITGAASRAWSGIANSISGFGASILQGVQGVWDSVCNAVGSAMTAIGNSASNGWNAVVSGVASIGGKIMQALQEIWNNILTFLGGFNLFESGAKLLDTFVEGIKSKISGLVETVSGALGAVREYLPFSDAKTGPLSTLTLSGSRFMTTLADGVNAGKGNLVNSVSGAVAAAGKELDALQQGLQTDATIGVKATGLDQLSPATATPVVPNVPPVPAPRLPDEPAQQNTAAPVQNSTKTITVTINSLNLPNVSDAQGFMTALQNELSGAEGMA